MEPIFNFFSRAVQGDQSKSIPEISSSLNQRTRKCRQNITEQKELINQSPNISFKACLLFSAGVAITAALMGKAFLAIGIVAAIFGFSFFAIQIYHANQLDSLYSIDTRGDLAKSIIILKAKIEKQKELLKQIKKLINESPKLQNLIQKYYPSHSEFVARTNFKLDPVVAEDDIFAEHRKLKLEEMYLSHQLEELKVFLDCYPDSRKCFYEEALSMFKKGEPNLISWIDPVLLLEGASSVEKQFVALVK